MTDHSYKPFEFFYDNTFEDYPTLSKDLGLGLFTYDVVANPGFVRATFTQENVNDIRNMHGIDAEAELERILVEELNRAIREDLQNMRETEIIEFFDNAFSRDTKLPWSRNTDIEIIDELFKNQSNG